MKQRGRKSEAALAVELCKQPDLEVNKRPDAPYDLTDEEADVWRGIVNNLPAHWFSVETFPLLSQYCRHIVQSRRIATLIQMIERGECDEDGSSLFTSKDYFAALRMQQAESRAIAALATKMRIAQQSTIKKEDKTRGVGLKRSLPWQK